MTYRKLRGISVKIMSISFICYPLVPCVTTDQVTGMLWKLAPFCTKISSRRSVILVGFSIPVSVFSSFTLFCLFIFGCLENKSKRYECHLSYCDKERHPKAKNTQLKRNLTLVSVWCKNIYVEIHLSWIYIFYQRSTIICMAIWRLSH